MGLFDFFKRKRENAPINESFQEIHINDSPSKNIVDKLEKIGYFKYADQRDIDELKKEVRSSLEESNYLSTVWNEEKPYNSKDYRHYYLDGETLYEQGGFIDCLQDFERLFNIIDFKLVITKHLEEWDSVNRWLNHSLTINGKDYVIFKNFKKGYGWDEAAQRFAEILNDQLIIQEKDERIFLANGGNDGRAIVLTEEQFKLLNPILKHPKDRPLRIEKWCRVMQVDPI